MKKLIIGLAVILSLICFSACEDDTEILTPDGETIKLDKTYDIYLPMDRIRTLNPFSSLDKDSYYFNKLVYEGLYKSGKNLVTEKVLVESEELETGAVTVKLKDGVKWHDGNLLTASDVKFSITCYKEGTGVYKSVVDKIDTARILDDKTIKIIFKNPVDASLSNLTFPILPKHNFKSVSESIKVDSEFVPVGTGRYRIKSFDLIRGIEVEGFKEFHGGKIPENILHFQILPQKSYAVNMMGIESMSVMFSENQDRASLFSNRDVKIKNFDSNRCEVIGFNIKGAVTGKREVRKAISYALNPKEPLKKAYYSNGVINKNIYYPNYLGLKSRIPMRDQNVNKAKKYLNKAGYHDIDKDGIMETASNEDLTLGILVNAENPTRNIAAGIIAEQLKKIKINAVVQNVPLAEYNRRILEKEYDMYIGGYEIQENYDLRFLLHGEYNNPVGYDNSKLNTLLNEMQKSIDNKTKKEAYKKIDKILKDDIPYYCLLYKTYGVIRAENMPDNFKPNVFDYYSGCEDWYNMLPKLEENKGK